MRGKPKVMLNQRSPRLVVSCLHALNHTRFFFPAQRFGKRRPPRQISQKKQRVLQKQERQPCEHAHHLSRAYARMFVHYAIPVCRAFTLYPISAGHIQRIARSAK